MSTIIGTHDNIQSERLSCGPESLQIAKYEVAEVLGVIVSLPDEKQLIKEGGVNSRKGMTLSSLGKLTKKYFEKAGLTVEITRNLDPSDLDYLREKVVLPLHLTQRNNSPHNDPDAKGYGYHFGVLQKIENDGVILKQPFGITEAFEKDERDEHWALSKEPISVSSQLLKITGIVQPYSAIIISNDSILSTT